MNAQTSNGNNLLIQGRIVYTIGSNLFEGINKVDYNTNAPIIGEDGQPVKEYGFGLAIPKMDPRTGQQTPEFQKIWQVLHGEAFTLYPSGQLPPDFAMKFKDGDAIDHNGKPFADREGYKGHIVLACTTRIPIKYFKFEGGNNILVNTGIKNGDYVNVQLNIKAHPAKGRGKAGLYVNPLAVQLIQAGKEIINTPSGDQMFGMAAPVYAGEVVAPVNAPMPGMMGQQAPAMPGQYVQQPMQNQGYNQQAPMGAPAMPGQGYAQQPAVQPHYDVLPQNHQPQQAPTMPGQGYAQQPMQNYGQGAPVMPIMPGQR